METEYRITVHGYDKRWQKVHETTIEFSVPGLDLDPRVRAGAMTMALAWARSKVPGFGSTQAQVATLISVNNPPYIG